MPDMNETNQLLRCPHCDATDLETLEQSWIDHKTGYRCPQCKARLAPFRSRLFYIFVIGLSGLLTVAGAGVAALIWIEIKAPQDWLPGFGFRSSKDAGLFFKVAAGHAMLAAPALFWAVTNLRRPQPVIVGQNQQPADRPLSARAHTDESSGFQPAATTDKAEMF